MNHESHEEDLAAYALGVLPERDKPALEQHLRSGCPTCATRLREFRRATDALALAGPRETPPAAARAEILSRIGAAVPSRAWTAPRWAAAAVLLLGVGGGLFFTERRAAGPDVAVAWTEGRAESGGRTLPAGSMARGARTVATGPDSAAELVLDGRVAVRLSADTEISLERKEGGLVVRLVRGGLMSLVKPGTRYRVNMPTLSAAVRGTAFYVVHEPSGADYLCLCEGRLSIEGPGFREDLVAEHHRAVRVDPGADAGRPGPAGMESHSDDDIARLAALLH
jgi:hypothetical protein